MDKMLRVIFSLTFLTGLLGAQEAEQPAGPDAVPFIQQTLERSTEFYTSGMKSLVDSVAKTVKLDTSAQQKLMAAAEAAVKEKMEKSRSGLWKTWLDMAKEGRVNQNSFWATYQMLPEAMLTPDRSELWQQGVKVALSPEQFTLWQKEEGERRDRVEKAIKDYLQRGREAWAKQRSEVRQTEAKQLAESLKLEPAVAAQLLSGASSAAVKGSILWGQGQERQLRQYVKSAFLGGAEERVAAIEAGNINLGTGSDSAAQTAEDAAWQAQVKQLLPPDVAAALEKKRTEREEKSLRAVAMMATAELDRRIRLTSSQRKQIEALLLATAKAHKGKVSSLLSQTYMNTDMLLMLLNGVEDTKAAQVLALDQLRGWREAVHQYGEWWNSL